MARPPLAITIEGTQGVQVTPAQRAARPLRRCLPPSIPQGEEVQTQRRRQDVERFHRVEEEEQRRYNRSNCSFTQTIKLPEIPDVRKFYPHGYHKVDKQVRDQ